MINKSDCEKIEKVLKLTDEVYDILDSIDFKDCDEYNLCGLIDEFQSMVCLTRDEMERRI